GLKFGYGPKKFFETSMAFADCVLFFNQIVDCPLVLITELLLMLVDSLCTYFHRIGYLFGKFCCSFLAFAVRDRPFSDPGETTSINFLCCRDCVVQLRSSDRCRSLD